MATESSTGISDADIEELHRAVSVIAPPGRETEAIAVVKRMIGERPRLVMSEDKYGNLIVRFHKEKSGRPLYFSAHLDHPAFVVIAAHGDEAIAEYRGGAQEMCAIGRRLLFNSRNGDVHVRIVAIEESTTASPIVRVDRAFELREGDVGALTEDRKQFACDDMAGVCACVQALDRVDHEAMPGPVRLVFTRAEEIGLIGAIGASHGGGIPAGSRIITIDARNDEQSNAVLVSGSDKTGPVNPRLIAECIKHGCDIEPTFVSATEAGAYGAFGFDSASVTFPIQHMHNNRDGTPSAEHIDMSVYRRLVGTIVNLMNGVSRESTRNVLLKHLERNTPTIDEL